MTDEKLVQSPECEDMHGDIYEDHVCPRCSSLLHHDYVMIPGTDLIELLWLCHYCGHTE